MHTQEHYIRFWKLRTYSLSSGHRAISKRVISFGNRKCYEHQSSPRSSSKQHYVTALVRWMESQDITHYWVGVNNRVSQSFEVWYLAVLIHSPYPKWRAWSQAKQKGRAKADKIFLQRSANPSKYHIEVLRRTLILNSICQLLRHYPSVDWQYQQFYQVVSLLPQLSHERMYKNAAFINSKLSFLSSKIANKS